ncbi:MAG: hypothetical protein K9J48_05295 [Desulfohalobiaceae bacterium]|nr:hypothetical protein [Desulfohalobiaceae bacterium]
MRTTMILLAGLLATLLLVAQAPAWQGGNMERGTVKSMQQLKGQAQNPEQLRSKIASTRAELNRELNRKNPNVDKIRDLNQKLARDNQNLRRMMQQQRQQQRGGWGMQRGGSRGGHMGGGHMMGGHGYR